MHTSDSTPTKTCRKCGVEYPATSEFFITDKRKPAGISARCRVCHNAQTRNNRREFRSNDDRRRLDNERLKQSRDARRNEYQKQQREYYATWIELGDNRDHKNTRQRRNYVLRSSKPEYRLKLRKAGLAYYHLRANDPSYRRHCVAVANRRREHAIRNGGRFTAGDIELILRSQKGLCWWCGKKVGDKYHVDHRIPLSRGGSNAPENLVISCPPCNLSKNDKLPHEWSNRLL